MEFGCDPMPQSGGVLQRLMARARVLATLDEALRRRLGPELGGHSRVANVRGDTVVVHVDSPAWSARLRFLTPQLLEFFQQQRGCDGVQQIKIAVRLPHRQRQRRAQLPRPLSRASAAAIRALAEASDDAPLRAALLRLAEHGEAANDS